MIKFRRSLESFASNVGEIIVLMFKSIFFIFQKPFNLRRIVNHIYIDGVKSMPVVLLTAVFTGAVLTLQSFFALNRLGYETFTGSLVGVSLTKELIPVLTGLMISGRVGASYSAEIGTMKVSEQIDALFTFGVNPIKYLISPRVVALMIMLPMLTLFGDFVGIFSGKIIADVVCRQNPVLFEHQLLASLEFWDVISGLIKSVFFGLTIAVIGSYFGLKTEGGAEGVGRSTTMAVVVASIIILVSDFFWSKILPFTLR